MFKSLVVRGAEILETSTAALIPLQLEEAKNFGIRKENEDFI
jgi:hypothetical protein